MPKLTVKDILDAKRKKKFTQVLVSDADTAEACEQAGIEMLSVRLANLEAVRKAAPNADQTGWLCVSVEYSATAKPAARQAAPTTLQT